MNKFITFYEFYQIIRSARIIKLNGNLTVHDPKTHEDEIALMNLLNEKHSSDSFLVLIQDSIFLIKPGLIIIGNNNECFEPYLLPWVISYG